MSNGHNLNEFLPEKDRLLMAAWTLPNDGSLSDEQRHAAMVNFAAYCKARGITHADVARKVGRPKPTTIRDLVQGVYREAGKTDEYIRSLNNWVEQHARQHSVHTEGRYVTTRVAKTIEASARMVRENHTMGLVIGPAGIGKTRCAQALHDRYVGAILISVMSGLTHPTGLSRALATALGARHPGPHRRSQIPPTMTERVIERLRGSDRLILVDEAHKLSDEGIEFLREIHDQTDCPILLFATKDLHDRIRRNVDPDHGQLYSRFDVIQLLTKGCDTQAGGAPLFTIDEIKQLYDQTPIRLSRDAAQWLRGQANQLGEGSLRRCAVLVANAARRARKRQGLDKEDTVTITADDLEFAETNLRVDDLDETQERRRQWLKEAAG